MTRALVVRVGRAPVVEEIDETLEAWQSLVGGYVERVPLGEGVIVLCNEDAGRLGLRMNRIGLRGDFFLAREAGGGLCELTQMELERFAGILR